MNEIQAIITEIDRALKVRKTMQKRLLKHDAVLIRAQMYLKPRFAAILNARCQSEIMRARLKKDDELFTKAKQSLRETGIRPYHKRPKTKRKSAKKAASRRTRTKVLQKDVEVRV